jgi:hypothetical protein
MMPILKKIICIVMFVIQILKIPAVALLFLFAYMVLDFDAKAMIENDGLFVLFNPMAFITTAAVASEVANNPLLSVTVFLSFWLVILLIFELIGFLRKILQCTQPKQKQLKGLNSSNRKKSGEILMIDGDPVIVICKKCGQTTDALGDRVCTNRVTVGNKCGGELEYKQYKS